MSVWREMAGSLGLGPAFTYAIAIYLLFLYLDRIASQEARRTISAWLRSEPSKRLDLRPAVIGAFDAIYSKPLLRPKALLRSAVFSLICVALMAWYFAPFTYFIFFNSPPMRSTFMTLLGLNLLSDYLSLFLVRHYLTRAVERLFPALVIAPLLGAVVVMAVYVSYSVADYSFTTNTFNPAYFWQALQVWLTKLSIRISSNTSILMAAFLVHAWLPLFALGAFATRVVIAVIKTFELSHWFIKRRDQTPFKAIGLVLAALVFLGVMVFSLIFAQPSSGAAR
jgi:hypothetical protein